MSAPPWQTSEYDETEGFTSNHEGPSAAPSKTVASDWHEVKTEDSRVYYYNSVTRKSVWEKPEELMNDFEKKLSKLAWKEYATADGKKYWYNVNTRESVWDIPDEYKAALVDEPEQQKKALSSKIKSNDNKPAVQSIQRHGPDVAAPSSQPAKDQSQQISQGSHKRTINFVQQKDKRQKRSNDYQHENYDTYEAAERAFFKFLDSHNVNPSWTWEQTVRELCDAKGYYVMKDPWHRKCAFDAYILNYLTDQSDAEKNRVTKIRKEFIEMLKSSDKIHSYTLWRTVKNEFSSHPAFNATSSETEQQQLFFEYKQKLLEDEKQLEKDRRKEALDDFCSLLRNMNFEPYTRWSVAQAKFDQDPRYTRNSNMKYLSKLDALVAFEDHVKHLEREYILDKQKQKKEKHRIERKNRDAFRALLQDLRVQKKITLRTKWKELYPIIKDDPRYLNLLGQSGSTPLDLFWDTIVDLENMYREKRNLVLDCLEVLQISVDDTSNIPEIIARLSEKLKDREESEAVTEDLIEEVVNRLRDKAIHKKAEEKRADERRIRRKIDNLRSAIKYLKPPISADASYDEIRPLISILPEFAALHSEEHRMAAFDKYIRRLREKRELEKQYQNRRGYYDVGKDESYLANSARPHGGYEDGRLEYSADLASKSNRNEINTMQDVQENSISHVTATQPAVKNIVDDAESSEEGEIR